MLQIGFLEQAIDSNLKNKVGGYPSYLGNVLDPIYCVICEERLKFLMQLFTPEETEIELEQGFMAQQEIDRMIHVFVCPRNHAVAVFRSQTLSNNSNDGTTLKVDCEQKEVWPEWEIVSEDFDELELQNALQNYNLQDNISADIDDEEQKMLENEQDTTVQVDDGFLKYQGQISLEPDQVLRYYRTDYSGQDMEPLWVSDNGMCLEVPDCPFCGGKRSLEFQITSQILNFLQLDHSQKDSLDFGTLIIYSCQDSCSSKTEFMPEFCWRQEFSTDGIKLPLKNPTDVIREKAKRDSEKALKDYLKQQQEDTRQRKQREKLEEYNQFKITKSAMSDVPSQPAFVQKVPDIIPFSTYTTNLLKTSPDISNMTNPGLSSKYETRLDESGYRELAPSLKSDETLTKLLLTQEQLSQEKRARGWIESELQAGKMQLASLAAKVDSLTATVESDTSIIRELSKQLCESDKRSKDSDQALLLKSEKQILKLHQMFAELLAKQHQSESTTQDTDDKQRMILEELNHMRYKLEAYSLKTNEFGQEVNARSRDLDQELQRGSETFRKLTEHDHTFETLKGNINSATEQFQKRLEQASLEIRHRLESDARNRIQFENNMRELHQEIRKTIQSQEKDNIDRIESLKATIFHQSDRDRVDKERISANLNDQLRILERVVKENQTQFLEKTIQQYNTMETSLEDEKNARKKFEADIRSEFDEGFKMIKQAIIKKSEENQQHISDSKIQAANAIKTLQESLILVERALEQKLQGAEEVLHAEIKARMDLEQRYSIFANEISEKIDASEEKTLSRIEEIIQDLNAENDKIRREIHQVAESLSISKSRNLDDLESRILQLGNRTKQAESDLQSKIQLALSSIESIKDDQMAAMEASESKLSRAISLLQNGDEDTLRKVLGVELLCSNIKNEIDDKLNLKSTQLDQTMEAFKSELSARVTVVEAKETQSNLQMLLVNGQKRIEEMSNQVHEAVQGVKDCITRNELDEMEIRLKSLVSSVQGRLLLLDETVINNSSQLSERILKSDLQDTEKKLKEILQEIKIHNADLDNNLVIIKEEMSGRITKSNLLEAEDRIKNQIHLIEDKFADIYSNIGKVKESVSAKASHDDVEKFGKELTKGIDQNEQRIIQALETVTRNREAIMSNTAQKLQELSQTVNESISAVEKRQDSINLEIDDIKASTEENGAKMSQKIEDIINLQKGNFERQSEVIERLKKAETENYSELTKKIEEIPEKISDLRNQQHELRQWMIETTQIEGETVARALLDIKHTLDTKISEGIFNQTVCDIQTSVQKMSTQYEIEKIEISQIRLKVEETEHSLRERIREIQINTDRSQKETSQSIRQQRDITIKSLEEVKERQNQIPKLIDGANIEIRRLRSDIDDRVHHEILKVEKEIANIKGALQSRVTENELDDAIGDAIRPIESRIDRLTIDLDDLRFTAENERQTDINRISPEPAINSSSNFYKPPHRTFTNSGMEEPLKPKGYETREDKIPEVDPRLEKIADNTSEY